MPAAQVELDDSSESLNRIVDLGDREQHLGVGHKAIDRWCELPAADVALVEVVLTWLFSPAYCEVQG
jgi:hypothetical protein